MNQTNNIDKINLLNMFIDKFPNMSKVIISDAEKECSKNNNYLSLIDSKKLDFIIDYISEKDLINNSIKSLLGLYSIIDFDFKSLYKDFFNNLELLNSESFFQENSIKSKSSSIEEINNIKNTLILFIDEYGNIYAQVIKQIYNIKKYLIDIKTIKNAEIETIKSKAEKQLIKTEHLKSELEKYFSHHLKNYELVEKIIKERKISELLILNKENKILLEKDFFEVCESLENINFDTALNEEERIENNFEFIESLPEKILFLNKLDSFKQNSLYLDNSSEITSDINLMNYKVLNLIKDKINLINPKIKVLSNTSLEKVFEKDYLTRAIEIKSLSGEYNES